MTGRVGPEPFGCLFAAKEEEWFTAWNTQRVRHVRYLAGPAATGGGDDFAVVTFCPSRSDRSRGVVVVLSGNLNETHYEFDCYTQIVVVTWAMSYEANPSWLPRLIEQLGNAAVAQHRTERVDIVAFSRVCRHSCPVLRETYPNGSPMWPMST